MLYGDLDLFLIALYSSGGFQRRRYLLVACVVVRLMIDFTESAMVERGLPICPAEKRGQIVASSAYLSAHFRRA
jgi:hypothetical protein